MSTYKLKPGWKDVVYPCPSCGTLMFLDSDVTRYHITLLEAQDLLRKWKFSINIGAVMMARHLSPNTRCSIETYGCYKCRRAVVQVSIDAGTQKG